MRARSTGDPGLSPCSRLVPTRLPRPGRAVIYLNIQVVKGQRKVICLLKEQISNEGEDKIFLIDKIQCVYERKERSRIGRTEAAVRPPALLIDDADAC